MLKIVFIALLLLLPSFTVLAEHVYITENEDEIYYLDTGNTYFQGNPVFILEHNNYTINAQVIIKYKNTKKLSYSYDGYRADNAFASTSSPFKTNGIINFYIDLYSEQIGLIKRINFNDNGNIIENSTSQMEDKNGTTTTTATTTSTIGGKTVTEIASSTRPGAVIPVPKNINDAQWCDMRQNDLLYNLYNAVVNFKNNDYQQLLNNSLRSNNSNARTAEVVNN